MVSLEELECGCCYELMVNPTTLTCGHSFCRYCLAKWSNISNKTECPECRQTWKGFPQINVHLRSIIEKSFPEEAADRNRTQIKLGDYKEMMMKFEKLGMGEGGTELSGAIDAQNVQAIVGIGILVVGAVLVFALLILLYYFLLSGPRTSDEIYFKPVEKWTTSEVVAWARGFADQLGYDYSDGFDKGAIDGKLLLRLSEDDLSSQPLNVFVALHRKIFIEEIDRLNMTKVKQPKTLWEYQSAHRTNALFLLFMLQDSPRFTLAYLHYMEYYTIFLPFLQTVTDRKECDAVLNEKMICPNTHEGVTMREKLQFYGRFVMFPYYFISQFAAAYMDVHYLTMWFIIVQCIMLTFRELSELPKMPRVRDLPREFLNRSIGFLLTCVWYRSLLYITPTIIVDIVFYCKLFYGPVDTANCIRQGNLRTSIVRTVLDGVNATYHNIWRVLRFFLNPRN